MLIYNPASGRQRGQREAKVSTAVSILRSSGIQAESCATTHAGSAVDQARQAAEAGYDTIIACGGDGTVNEVLNGLMRTSADATLGVIPLGSGNLLATDLLLPSNPEAAVKALLRYQPRRLSPGVIRYQDRKGQRERFFIVAAGVGSDAELMYQTAKGSKERYGIYAYFLEMYRMALNGKFSMFRVEWLDENGVRHHDKATLVMAIRAKRFPGLLKRVRLGSELARNDYRLMVFRTDKVRHFLNFFLSVASGLNWTVPQVGLPFSTWFRCTPLEAQAPESIHSEADGEILGTLPVEVGMDQRTFKLLMPENS
ncbi:MAG TPA: diacylglycerol kinase family protein [Candidatus Angelobacter sp.]|nr:diacylglycerol kinase family protein [Candidatus Angelobacter sp.]